MQFKTNINCGGCIATVSPFLDQEARILKWEVDTENPEKILDIEVEGMTEKEIISLLSSAGFQAQPLKKGLFRKILGL